MDQVEKNSLFVTRTEVPKVRRLKLRHSGFPCSHWCSMMVPAPPHHLEWSSQQPSKGHAVLILPERTLRCMQRGATEPGSSLKHQP